MILASLHTPSNYYVYREPFAVYHAGSKLGEALVLLLRRHQYHRGKGCQGRQDAINRRFN